MKFVNIASTYVLGIFFPALGFLAVAGRFMSRRLKRAGYSWDDYIAIIALLLTTGCGVVMIVGAASNTIGSHNEPATAAEAILRLPPRQIYFEKLEFVFFTLSYLAIGSIRLVFLLLFRRIFRGRVFTIVNWFLVGIVSAWSFAFFIVCITECGSHIEASWGPLVDVRKYCVDSFSILVVATVTDFVIDLSILVLPITCIWQLKAKTETKVGISLVFLLAGLSVAVSCARMVFMIDILNYPFGTDTPLFGTAGTSDTIGVVSVVIWFTMLEMGVALITMNLPVLPGLVRNDQFSKTFDRIRRSWNPKPDFRPEQRKGSEETQRRQ